MNSHDGRVVSNFITQALQNKPLTLYGDGSQTRSFCYVSDMTQGLLLMMNQNKEIGPVNIGNPEEISMKTLAQKIIKLTHSQSETEYHQLPADDPQRRQPNISKAQKTLNWQPTTSLQEGLVKTIEYFKSLN